MNYISTHSYVREICINNFMTVFIDLNYISTHSYVREICINRGLPFVLMTHLSLLTTEPMVLHLAVIDESVIFVGESTK